VKKFIREGEAFPRWYGIAYREVHRLGAICYPIPLNLIVSVWHHFYQWLIAGQWDWKTEHDTICEECFNRGKREAERIQKLNEFYGRASSTGERKK